MPDLIAQQFVAAPTGAVDYGMIDEATGEAIGRQHGPIRLQHGYEGPKGFGNRHVEAYPGRMKQLKGLGFNTFVVFAFEVSQNYTTIRRGNEDRLILVYPVAGHDLRLFVNEAIQDDKFFWNIVSGLPQRRYSQEEILMKVVRTGGREPSPSDAVRSRFATLSLPKKP